MVRVERAPVSWDARQITIENRAELAKWSKGMTVANDQVLVHTPTGSVVASLDDWIVEEKPGEFQVYGPQAFAAAFVETMMADDPKKSEGGIPASDPGKAPEPQPEQEPEVADENQPTDPAAVEETEENDDGKQDED